MTNLDSQKNFLHDLLQLLSQEGSDAFSQILQVLLNNAMLLERSAFLGAKPYERTSALKGYANGFKSKSLRTSKNGPASSESFQILLPFCA
jgi:putative transposase